MNKTALRIIDSSHGLQDTGKRRARSIILLSSSNNKKGSELEVKYYLNLTKQVRGLCAGNCSFLMTDIKD